MSAAIGGAGIVPRVSEQMRLIRERRDAEIAAKASSDAAMQAEFEKQLAESHIVWEAEVLIELEERPLDIASLSAAVRKGCGCKRIPDIHFRRNHYIDEVHQILCPYGPLGEYYSPSHIEAIKKEAIETTQLKKGTIPATKPSWYPSIETALAKEKIKFCNALKRKHYLQLIHSYDKEQAEKERIATKEAMILEKARMAKVEELSRKSYAQLRRTFGAGRNICNITEGTRCIGTTVSFVSYVFPTRTGAEDGALFPRAISIDCKGVWSTTPGHFPYSIVPVEWNDHFARGVIPFMSQCPTCKKQTKMNTDGYRIVNVGCSGHYRWDASTNTHYTLHYVSGAIHAIQRVWDPADPDGSIAERSRKAKAAEEIRAQITALQSKLIALTE